MLPKGSFGPRDCLCYDTQAVRRTPGRSLKGRPRTSPGDSGFRCVEGDVQAAIEENTLRLTHRLGWASRAVIPQQRLGSEYVTGFLIGQEGTACVSSIAVELESPKARLFTKKGDQTKELTHTVRQTTHWPALDSLTSCRVFLGSLSSVIVKTIARHTASVVVKWRVISIFTFTAMTSCWTRCNPLVKAQIDLKTHSRLWITFRVTRSTPPLQQESLY